MHPYTLMTRNIDPVGVSHSLSKASLINAVPRRTLVIGIAPVLR
jgi:hypothetical protein